MNQSGSKLRKFPIAQLLIAVLFTITGLLYLLGQASQAALPRRSILMDDNRASASAMYTIGFDLSTPETLGSIKVLFCANDPIIENPCVVPSGFDVSGATLTGQNGEVGFGIYGPGTNANTLVLSRIPLPAGAGSVSYVLSGVVNPDTVGSFYARLQTFATNDASGLENEHAGVAMSIASSIQVNATVPPYLLFCGGVVIGGFDCGNASGNYINFGNLSNNTTASATSQLLTATNAPNGYTTTVSGQTMTSGNNIISAINVADVSRPGVAQFGMNLVSNLTPLVGNNPAGPGSATPTAAYGVADFFRYVSGDAIATTANADDFRKMTASYILNIPIGQPSGVYATTLTYICLANF